MKLYSHTSASGFAHLDTKVINGLNTFGEVFDHFRQHALCSKAMLNTPAIEIRFQYRRSDTVSGLCVLIVSETLNGVL